MAIDRIFGATRVVVDLFGPLVDIDKIDVLRGTNPRFSTEEAIATHPDIGRPPDGAASWTPELVRKIVHLRLADHKLALPLIDGAMLKLLCEAAKSCEVAIVSSIPERDGFEVARKALLKYMRSFLGCTVLQASNFHHCPKNNGEETYGVERFLRDNLCADFTIVVDDGPPFNLTDADDLVEGQHYDEWLSGQGGVSDIVSRFRGLIDARRRVANTLQFLDGVKKLEPGKYAAIDGFLVHDDDVRATISNQVQTIRRLLDKEGGKRPICVFLSGAPGSGKSYFVQRCAEKLGADADYPATSLSGVNDGKFDRAVEQHIELVFNREIGDAPTVAFLDEVDTTPNKHHAAFRLLMDAMTRTRTNDLGLAMKGQKSGTVAKLVWFFAGSAGRTREEFIAKLKKVDRKVIDFFDRIHFNLELPSADDAGQAMVQGLASIWKYDKDRVAAAKATSTPARAIEKVGKDVLLLLGVTGWSSVRQLDTICRLALGKMDPSEPVLKLEHFDGVGTLREFHDRFQAVNAAQRFVDQNLEVDWTKM